MDQEPDYLTAACGLALGVGLTSGPLLPDLLQRTLAGRPSWCRLDHLIPGIQSGSPRARWISRIWNWLRGGTKLD
jgi:hypothetical protein